MTIQQLSEKNKKELYQIPVWITLLAALENDESLSKSERKAAEDFTYWKSVKRHHPSVKEYYKEVHENFEDRLNREFVELQYQNRATQKEEILNRVRGAIAVLIQVDQEIAQELLHTFNRLYRHVSQSENHFITAFALPVLGQQLIEGVI